MKIRFITPYFPPEVGAPQTRIYELALRLVKLGHEVSVVTTFPNYPTGVVPLEWRGKLKWAGVQDGIRIWRFWSFIAPNRGFLKRILTHLSFALSSALGGLLLPRCDVMIVESPPLFDGFAGAFLSLLRRTPYVFVVSDLWPESAVRWAFCETASPFVPPSGLSSSSTIMLPPYSDLLAVFAGKSSPTASNLPTVLVFRNSVDCDFFHPNIDASGLRRELHIADDQYVLLYAGTLGLAHGLPTVLDAAALLQQAGHNAIRFILAGDGAESDRLREKARDLKLSNLAIISSLPKSRVPELLNAANCVLVHLRDLEIFRGALPTKMFEALACAKPMILGIQGEAEDLIREADAGACIAPEDPAAICSAVLSLAGNPTRARELGENGRSFVLDHFNRDKRALELSATLRRLIQPHSPETTATPDNAPCLECFSEAPVPASLLKTDSPLQQAAHTGS